MFPLECAKALKDICIEKKWQFLSQPVALQTCQVSALLRRSGVEQKNFGPATSREHETSCMCTSY